MSRFVQDAAAYHPVALPKLDIRLSEYCQCRRHMEREARAISDMASGQLAPHSVYQLNIAPSSSRFTGR